MNEYTIVPLGGRRFRVHCHTQFVEVEVGGGGLTWWAPCATLLNRFGILAVRELARMLEESKR